MASHLETKCFAELRPPPLGARAVEVLEGPHVCFQVPPRSLCAEHTFHDTSELKTLNLFRELAKRAPRRALGLLTLVVLMSSLAGGSDYLFCKMAERPMESCCCPHGEPAASHEALQQTTEARARRSCCETRHTDAVASPAVEAPNRDLVEIAPAVLPSEIASAPRRTQPPRTRLAPTLVSCSRARASPIRRGKLRARLGVMLC